MTFSIPTPALADSEASNVVHVAAGPYGRCYAKSVPDHIYDPDDQPRQQGYTEVYKVEAEEDVLLGRYDWFAQQIFINCLAGAKPVLVRMGPWHRGHDPAPDHLALAFYQDGEMLQTYSTLDIAGPDVNEGSSFSRYKNASASVSHYTVFKRGLNYVIGTPDDGPVFDGNWVIKGETIDGRTLRFDPKTGALK